MFIVLYRPLPDGRETLGSMISILSPTNQETEFYETIATGHEYEILDKYHGNQVYEISPTAEPKPETIQLQPTGDYKFTHCPAYISVATTDIHRKPPSTQPTTAQDDQIESG